MERRRLEGRGEGDSDRHEESKGVRESEGDQTRQN